MTGFPLPPRETRKRTETDVVMACLQAIGRVRGVRASRNNVGVLKDLRGIPITYGLGTGSPDIIGAITFGGPMSAHGDWCLSLPLAFAFGIEVKRPTVDGGRDPTNDQKAWALVARRRGFLVGLARAPDEAVAFVREAIAEIARRLR